MMPEAFRTKSRWVLQYTELGTRLGLVTPTVSQGQGQESVFPMLSGDQDWGLVGLTPGQDHC